MHILCIILEHYLLQELRLFYTVRSMRECSIFLHWNKLWAHNPRRDGITVVAGSKIQACSRTKLIDQLLSQCTTWILVRYLKMTLGQCSFLENLVDIGNWYWHNNNIVISQISTCYFVNIDLILSYSLWEHSLNSQFLLLRSQYWLNVQKYLWVNIQFWKIRLILEKYIDPIIVLSFSQLQLKRAVFS